MTSSISNTAPYTHFNPYHNNILRLPTLQSTPNSISQFYNHKTSKTSSNESKAQQNLNGSANVKRKRSWSRAVFSNLQRKGLERQFEFQKYITKPDRKKLAARLGLKDAQVKVWFQVNFCLFWNTLLTYNEMILSFQLESSHEVEAHNQRHDSSQQSYFFERWHRNPRRRRPFHIE